MDKVTSAGRRLRGGQEWLDRYQPQRIDPAVWSLVRSFVLRCAGRLGMVHSSAALRTVRIMAMLAAWAVGEGLPLDVEVVLDPDTIERFITAGVPEGRSRATYRSVLRQVGPKLTTRAPWEARPAAVARRHVAAPYSPVELVGLQLDARNQPTAGRVRAARALLALGAGAGLDGRWVSRVTAEDVLVRGGVVVVRVGEPAARVVPVLNVWEEEVLDLVAGAGGEFLVGGRSVARNRAGALAASLVVANGHPRFSAARLRSTWLVTHLSLGTRLPELARAAGLQGITVVSDLLPFVSQLDDLDAFELLRGVR